MTDMFGNDIAEGGSKSVKQKVRWCCITGFPYLIILMLYVTHKVTMSIAISDKIFFGSLLFLALCGIFFGIVSLLSARSVFQTAMREQWTAHRLA